MKSLKDFLVHIIHIILIGGLFLYVGIVGSKLPLFIYPILLFLGIFIIFYHGYKAIMKYISGSSVWVNIFHILIIAPLLIIIGTYGKNTPRMYYEFILMLGFASIGYHGYYLILNF